jgi:uncharacterized protein (TIGR02145 family)
MGQYSCTFYPGKDKYYLLTVASNYEIRTIKMVSLNSIGDDNCRIAFTGNEDNPINLKSFKDINNFGFDMGDELKFVGYTALGQSIITDSPTGNKTYEFQFAMNIPCPGITTVTYEDQTYNTVQIGNHCWFKENLNLGTIIDGGNNQLNNSIIEKYCYNNDPANCAIYGGLYQWDEMMQYTTQPGSQGICPNGWHIPTDEEWCETTQYIDPTVNCEWEDWSGTDVGTKMKSTTGWNSGGNGSNSSGFTALPGGGNLNPFFYLGLAARFWTSTQFDFDESWDRMLRTDYNNISRGYFDKEYGFSVRCVLDN